jgi:hypothetical protein
MYMKINGVSSIRRSKTELGAGTQDRSGSIPHRVNYLVEGRTTATRSYTAGREVATTQAFRQRTRSRTGEARNHKDVKNEGRSGNVYESKGPWDTLPDTKGDICARLHAVLQKSTRISQKPAAHLPLLERLGAIPGFKMGPR